jgi:hypothetical protein
LLPLTKRWSLQESGGFRGLGGDMQGAGAAPATNIAYGRYVRMNETLKRIGGELRRVFAAQLSRPLNWRMIDRLVSLEEADEDRAAKGAKRARLGQEKLPK